MSQLPDEEKKDDTYDMDHLTTIQNALNEIPTAGYDRLEQIGNGLLNLIHAIRPDFLNRPENVSDEVYANFQKNFVIMQNASTLLLDILFRLTTSALADEK